MRAQTLDRNSTAYRIGPNSRTLSPESAPAGNTVQSSAHDKKPASGKTVERSTFWATFARGNDRYELIVKIDWSESRMPLFKANCLTRKESSPRAKVRPCSSASPNPGCELFCSTCTSRRTILCHSGARPSRLTRRRLGWLGHFDSASPERLIPSCREPPRHFLTCRHLQTLARADASGTGSLFYWWGSLVGVESLVSSALSE